MIQFRPLTAVDFPMLLMWLQRPHIKQWWDDGDDTLEKVRAHYSSNPETTWRFIVELDGADSGYFQYHRYNSRHIATDQFLANETMLGEGIGTRCLKAFIKLIIHSESVEYISVDPHPQNMRAIRCYEKAGFLADSSRSNSSMHYMVMHAI
jgi:RimJ/RimL family protein N-acetyltransferase